MFSSLSARSQPPHSRYTHNTALALAGSTKILATRFSLHVNHNQTHFKTSDAQIQVHIPLITLPAPCHPRTHLGTQAPLTLLFVFSSPYLAYLHATCSCMHPRASRKKSDAKGHEPSVLTLASASSSNSSIARPRLHGTAPVLPADDFRTSLILPECVHSLHTLHAPFTLFHFRD